MKENEVIIYHNPECGTSRNVLGLIQNAGIEPLIIEYLKTPPSKQTLQTLIKDAGLKPSEALRRNVSEFEALEGLTLSEDQIIEQMLLTPILINRPFVVTAKGTALCRPSEKVLEILIQPQSDHFYKEDGEKVI